MKFDPARGKRENGQTTKDVIDVKEPEIESKDSFKKRKFVNETESSDHGTKRSKKEKFIVVNIVRSDDLPDFYIVPDSEIDETQRNILERNCGGDSDAEGEDPNEDDEEDPNDDDEEEKPDDVEKPDEEEDDEFYELLEKWEKYKKTASEITKPVKDVKTVYVKLHVDF